MLGGILAYRYRTTRRHMPILLTVVAASYLNQRGVFVLLKQTHALDCVTTGWAKNRYTVIIFFTGIVNDGRELNTLRTGLLNCLNARSRGLTFRHRASSIQGQVFRYSSENAFYIFNQQIHFII